MRRIIKMSGFMAVVLISGSSLLLGTGGCGGGTTTATRGLSGADSVTGTALAANGTDPIAGATVFIASSSGSGLVLGTGGKRAVSTDCGADNGGTVTCDDPSVTACASSCSCADGTFTLDTSDCPEDADTIQYSKGSFLGTAELDCTADADCTANITGSTEAGSTANIAVVSGAYDEIENVLAKLGFGDVYPEGSEEGTPGTLELGTEDFTIYKCGGSRDFEMSTLDPDEATYKDCDQLFGSLTEMQEYDIIFINCGANENTAELESLIAGQGREAAHLIYHQKGLKAVSTEVAGRLRDFVEGGGTLYVTDLAYDYVEQSIPEFMDYEDGGDDDAATAETANAAQQGTSGIVSDATVNNATMADWLNGISSNTIDAALAPNGGNCDTTENGNASSLLEGTDDGVRIGDFLSGWGVMRQAYAGDDDTFVWIQGPVDFSGGSDETRPLTASRAVDEGCVLYSSYHTSHSCPTTGFWPQERVLQYLVFETAGQCTP